MYMIHAVLCVLVFKVVCIVCAVIYPPPPPPTPPPPPPSHPHPPPPPPPSHPPPPPPPSHPPPPPPSHPFNSPGEWSMEDKVVFEQAFRYHGKHFQRIRSMVSHQKKGH